MATVPDGYIRFTGPSGWWFARDGTGPFYFDVNGTVHAISGGGGGAVADITEAELALIPAAAGNLNLEYQVTDRNSGRRVKSDGTSWVNQGPGNDATAGIPTTTWAARGSAATVGEIKRVTDLGNNPNIFIVADGTYWQPFGDRVCIYRMAAEIVGTGTLTNTSTLPNVTIPANLLNLYGSLEAVLEANTNALTPIAATWTCNWDGADFAGPQGTNRRLDMRRKWRNKGSAALQNTITKGNSESGGPIIATTDSTADRTKNTATDLVVSGSVVFTHASAIVGTVKRYEIWWSL